jgi:cell division protein FtsZ
VADPVHLAAEPDFDMDEEVAPVVSQPRARRIESLPESEPLVAHVASVSPPQPERVMRPTRMPRVEDLPAVAQKQIRDRTMRTSEPDLQEKRTLLQRLATVGFGRREEGMGHLPADPVPVAVPPAAEAPARPAVSPAHAEYVKRTPKAPAYRPAQGQLDPQGRSAPAPRGMDDEHLEIPAFLRRQST